ncbi:MAG: EAL domain-containing protein [Cellulosilyticaceae bacterium]
MRSLGKIDTYQTNQIFKEIVNEIDDCLMIYDIAGKLIYTNRQVEYLTGYSEEELQMHEQLGSLANTYNETLVEKMKTALGNGRKFDTICHLNKKDGTPFYLAVSMMGVKDKNNEMSQYICIGKDITSAKVLQEKMHKIKYLDEVTGLPSQAAFLELLYNKISGEKDKAFAIILLDITKMSYINTTYGLSSGDIVLKEVGNRIKKVIGNKCILAKLGPDIFVVMQDYSEAEHTTQELIENIFKQMEIPISIEAKELYLELKGGVALYPCHGETAGQVINNAQITLAKAKEMSGKNHYLFYVDTMQEEVQKQMLLESDIRKAYNNNEFIVYYQPFIDLEKRELTGMEALLRRKKPTGEIMAPGSFIGLLEQMELIDQVGICVIEAVCKQLREWMDKGFQSVPISINLSSAQFKNSDLVEKIMAILEKYQIEPQMIILEITETMVMTDTETAQDIIRALKKQGFAIAIDDFGTGYSSLGYLKKFLFDHLKIDISFIREVVENPQDRAIVAAIISIAKALRLKTVAEGIETLEQLDLMHEMGCEVGQGYYWDAPMDPEGLEQKYLIKA